VNGAVEFFRQLGPSRLAAMGAVAAMLVGFFAFIILKVSQPAMAPLYSDLTVKDSSAIVRELETLGIAYELRQDGAQIMVPKDSMLRLRMRLAEKGIPAGGSVGYEIFDKSDALGTTSFVQNINHLRALEGELARTIGAIDRIQAARVHLVIPERQLFQRDKVEPSASIVVKLRGSLETQQIRAIQHLVASAVQGMKAGRVAIVDEQGNMLAGLQDDDPQSAMAATLQDRTSAFEKRLETQIESIIASVVGQGRARVRVSAELDYNRVTQVSDTYDPNGQVVRSTQTKEENNSSQNPDRAVTVGAQVPGGQQPAAGDQRRDQSASSEELINYEISKTSRTEVLEAGRMKRVSVAVLVDGVYSTGSAGEVVYQPRQQADLDQIAALVRSSVGFDQKRGDLVEVVNLRFAEAPASLPLEAAKAGWQAMFDFTKDDILRLAELGVLLLMTLIVLLVAVRPLMKRMFVTESVGAAAGMATAVMGPDGKTLLVSLPVTLGADGKPVVQTPEEAAIQAAAEASGTAGGPVAIAPPPENPMGGKLELAKAQGALQASSINKVGEMVQQFPSEAVTIIRGWLTEG
jgi:flagellar M-ring protein FliF